MSLLTHGNLNSAMGRLVIMVAPIHGLWPQYSSGGYPSYCTTEPFDPSVPDKVGWTDMTTSWPNAQYATTDPNYDDFWDHEWTKHFFCRFSPLSSFLSRTCSQLSQYNYFNDAIALIKKFGTPASVTQAAANGGSVSAATVRNDFGGAAYASLQCESGKYLSGVFTCWSKENSVPKTQIVCPSDVQNEDTCTSSTIIVTTF
jgi:ribonuclease I